MEKFGGDADFLEETFGSYVPRDVGLQDLDGNVAVVAEVVGREYFCHPSGTECSLNPVSVLNGC